MATLRPRKQPAKVQLRGYDSGFLDCRNLGHVWRTVGFFEAGGVVKRRLMCQRCDTDRTDRWQRDGTRLSGSYSYADGYRVEGVSPKPFEVRLELMRRATIFTTEEAMLASMTGEVTR